MGIVISVGTGSAPKAETSAVKEWDRKQQNLEQYRAVMALASAKDIEEGVGGGQAVAKKVATMIRENGFLGALAFAVEKKKDGYKNPAHQSVFEAIRKYLVGAGVVTGCATADDLMANVAKGSAESLRYVTAEAIAYMNYLRRFAKPDKGGSEEDV